MAGFKSWNVFRYKSFLRLSSFSRLNYVGVPDLVAFYEFLRHVTRELANDVVADVFGARFKEWDVVTWRDVPFRRDLEVLRRVLLALLVFALSHFRPRHHPLCPAEKKSLASLRKAQKYVLYWRSKSSIFAVSHYFHQNDAFLSSRTIGAYITESDPNPKSDKRTISCRI